MNPDATGSESAPSVIAPPESAPAPSALRNTFRGPDGIRAGWRFAIFVLLFVAFISLALLGLALVPGFAQMRKQAIDGTLHSAYLIVFEGAQFGAALLAAWVMSRIERRKLGSYGIPLQGAFGEKFWIGIFWGLAFMSAELLAICALGGFSFGGLALGGVAVAKYAALWAIAFVLVGFAEEFVFRGYAQFTLATGMGFWPAAILLSAAFGAGHLFNAGEGWIGALSVMVFGLFACFTLRRTGSLWFAIGFHAAGDYAESFLYSVRDSGTVATGHLLNSSFHGSKWITGGSIGPEGSVFVFVMFAVSFFLFAWLYPGKGAEPEKINPS